MSIVDSNKRQTRPKMVEFGVSMDSETIRRIEEHKGYLSRAKFVLMCVHRQLDEEERQQKKKVTAAEEAALPAK